jgi:hypothetical protein
VEWEGEKVMMKEIEEVVRKKESRDQRRLLVNEVSLRSR